MIRNSFGELRREEKDALACLDPFDKTKGARGTWLPRPTPFLPSFARSPSMTALDQSGESVCSSFESEVLPEWKLGRYGFLRWSFGDLAGS